MRRILRNELDKMMGGFKKSAPDFYTGYFAARVVIDRTGTHAPPKKPATPPAPPHP